MSHTGTQHTDHLCKALTLHMLSNFAYFFAIFVFLTFQKIF